MPKNPVNPVINGTPYREIVTAFDMAGLPESTVLPYLLAAGLNVRGETVVDASPDRAGWDRLADMAELGDVPDARLEALRMFAHDIVLAGQLVTRRGKEGRRRFAELCTIVDYMTATAYAAGYVDGQRTPVDPGDPGDP